MRQNAELGLRVRNFYGPDGKHAPEEFQPQIDVDPWLERLGLAPFKTNTPGSSPAGSASAPPSPAPWRSSPTCC